MLKTSIKDGQGTNLEACVKKVGTLTPKEQAVCVNISGTSPGQSVTTSDSAAGGQLDVFLTQESTNSFDPDGVTTNAAINATVGNPIYFSFIAIPNVDFIITDVIIIGIGNGIKINNWLSQNSPLDDPCELMIKADNDPLTALPFSRTRDLAAYATLAGFELLVEAGGDMVKTIRQYKPLLVLRKRGKFGTLPGADDFVRWKIQDSMTQIIEITIQLRGFTVEPDTV